MSNSSHRIAKRLGATTVGTIPDVGGGPHGAARLAAILSVRLTPSRGRRPGRPSVKELDHHPKVPMSRRTVERLKSLSARMSTNERKVSPMQVAAQLLEDSLELCTTQETS